MTRLIKVADWDGGVGVNVVFVHGLGGHAYDTWRKNGNDETFWPAWLARDIPGLAAWTLAYDAPPTNWFGTSMALQDRAKNVIECMLGQPELRGYPLVFVCHSLGGLVIKQVLRTADGRRAYSATDAAFLDAAKGVVFVATPHTGSLHATLLDRLRLIAWPSASTLDLIKNNAGLRDLNVWYRNWSGVQRHKVFYEKRGTTAGVIVADDSADPGLLHVDPVAVDADHVDICKPADDGDLVYARTRDFIMDEIVPGDPPGTAWGTPRRLDLPALPRSRSWQVAPIAVRLAVLLIIGLVAFKGVQALLFPPDLLSAATVEQIEATLRLKSPKLTATQIDQFIQSLRELRGDPSFERAVDEAKKGNTRVAQGIWLQIYENGGKEEQQARERRAKAARSYAASAVVNDVREGLKWYRDATSLDPDNMEGWFGLGDAAMAAGILREADQGFLKYIEIAKRTNDERKVAVGLQRHGDVLVAQGNLAEALKAFRDGHDIFKRLAQTDPGNARHQRDLSVSHNKIGDVRVAQGNLAEALKSFRDGLTIAQKLAQADPGNTGWQRDLSVSYNRIGGVLVAQGNLAEALKSFRDGLTIAQKLAQTDPGNAGWQRDLSVSYNRIGGVLVAQGNLAEALKSFRDGLTIAQKLAQTDPGNAGWQRDLSVSYDKIGNVLVGQGNLPEALKSFRDEHDIFKRLAEADPANAGSQRDLSVSYDKIGNVLVAQGNLPEALKSFRDGLTIAQKLAKADPGNAGWQRDLSVSYDKIGTVLVGQGNLPEALKSFRDEHDIFKRLAETDPANAGWQRDLSVSYDRIGNVLVGQGNLPEALKSFHDGLTIAQKLAETDPGNAGWQRDLSVSYDKIGTVLVAQGNLPEALKSFRDEHDIFERLAQADPGNAGWQGDLSVSYDNIGDVLVAQGNLPEALKSFRGALAIRERLAQADPSNARWQVDLARSHWKLAENGDDAPRRWAFLVATLQKLKEENRLTPEQEKWLPEAEGKLAKTR
jgi:tetratricopeptide (TPR) repeat protein